MENSELSTPAPSEPERRAFLGVSLRTLLGAVVIPFVLQRALLCAIGVFAAEFIPQRRAFLAHPLPSVAGLDIWMRWDSLFYLAVAERGYVAGDGIHAAAFFPLYPALSAALAVILPLPVAAWLVANLAALLALILLYVLVRETEDTELARRSVLVALVFPTSFFLSAVYAESTYLALCLGAVLAYVRKRQLLAALLVGAACLARPQGFVCLTVPFALAWLIRSRRWRELPWFTLGALLGAGLLLSVHYFSSGDPLAFLHSSTVRSLGAFKGEARSQASHWAVLLDEGLGPNLMRRLLNWGALLLVLLSAVHWLRRKNFEFAALTLLTLAVPLVFHATLFDAASMARYTLLAFPVFIAIARWSLSGSRAWLTDTGFVMLQSMLFALFASNYWVE
ncbi:MAG TPA: glycosyltransferase 87 family protein [Polyangiaceae bacterium]|nr:glycosyltransferase 87 family protein [Polyangiaceae bacterium]